MEEKNQTVAQEAPTPDTKQEPASDAAQNSQSAEKIVKSGMDVFKKQAVYPTYAVIMCVGAAIGHLFGTYVFTNDLLTCTSLGMGVGILAAFLYSRKNKKTQDEP